MEKGHLEKYKQEIDAKVSGFLFVFFFCVSHIVKIVLSKFNIVECLKEMKQSTTKLTVLLSFQHSYSLSEFELNVYLFLFLFLIFQARLEINEKLEQVNAYLEEQVTLRMIMDEVKYKSNSQHKF